MFCDVNIHLTENILDDAEVLTQNCHDWMADTWFPVATVILCAASSTMNESEQNLILTPSRFKINV